MSVIQVVRDSAHELAQRCRRLAKTLADARSSGGSSAPAGAAPNALAALDYLSFDLPRGVMKCSSCGGVLRAVPAGGDYKIVCDQCEYFTYAGPYAQLIADVIGEARATLTRN